MKQLLVIQHVPHEGLGTFEPVFRQAGLTLRTLRAYEPKACWPSFAEVDAVVVMGGPQGVNEQAAYPYLKRELELIRQALKAEKPIVGVCLGSQLLAAVLGAKVTKNPQKEIGWYPLMREFGADGDPMWEAFGPTETVFQWHGDTFELPKGAVHLASSPLCQNQAFRYGDNAYGLQFHVEVTEAVIHTWLTVNKNELTASRGVIDPAAIRNQTARHLNRLQALSRHIAATFSRLMTTGAPMRVQSNIQYPIFLQ